MQTINLDLSVRSIIPLLYAKQGDVGRKFKAILTDGGVAYPVPAGAAVSVWYSGASGEGNYTDVGADSAVSVSGNEITVELITQMLANYGDGNLCLAINTADGDQIGTWNIPYMVEPLPGMGSAAAQAYFTAFSQAVQNLPYPDNTLSVSGRAADAGAVGTALASKAPAGYGLGEERCKFVSLDEITKNGYYLLWLDTANGDFSTGQFVCHAVVNANTNSVHLSGKHSGGFVHRDKVDGVWQPWEWVNPPMIPGVEYRTTERYNGKPVYTMLVDCLNGPNASQKMVTIPSTNAEQYIYCSLFCDAPAVFPLGGNDHTTDFQYGGIFLNQIKIVSQVDASTDHFYAIVKYTKTTD